jgi:P pilus assembly chaperone PapD
MFRFAFFPCWIISCLFTSVALADISVSPIVIDLLQKPDAEIAVKNYDTKRNAYVEVTAYLVINPANRNGPKRRVRHPEQDGLLIFPAKLVLLPGQTQFVRVVKTAKSLSSDRVYEVDFVPKVATRLLAQKQDDGSMLGIRVIIGYGARVTLRPDVPQPALTLRRLGDKLIIKNTGNTLLNITSCTQQVAHRPRQIALPNYTLFVGQTIEKRVTHPGGVVLSASFMGKPLGPFSVS